jgi:PAS domain S-box-containing protein
MLTNTKSKLFPQNKVDSLQSLLPKSHQVDTSSKNNIIICSLPMPPHVPFFISGDIGKTLGYEPEDVIGNTNFWVNTIHMADIPQLFTGFYHMFIRGYHVYEYRLRCKNGTYKQMLLQILLHRHQKGKPATVMACLGESILETWCSKYGSKDADSNGNECMEMTIDSKNRIRSINSGAEKLIGYSPKKLVGKSPLDFIPPDYVFTASEIHTKIVNQKHDFIRYWSAITHQDSSLRFLMHDCSAYVGEHRERIMKVKSRDITDHVFLDDEKRSRLEKQLLSTLARGEHAERNDMSEHPLEKLSAREREILYLTVEGFSSTRIGERLSISSRTVEAHRANLMRKLNANSINQLVRYMVFNIYSTDTTPPHD